MAWGQALARYWDFVKAPNLALERSLNALDLERIRGLTPQGWYDFLRDEYFRWKYTAPNRYATTTIQLRKHLENCDLEELEAIRQQLLALDPSNVRLALRTAVKIRGLGTAGASGLMALMYPRHIATVEQFVVKALPPASG